MGKRRKLGGLSTVLLAHEVLCGVCGVCGWAPGASCASRKICVSMSPAFQQPALVCQLLSLVHSKHGACLSGLKMRLNAD